MERRRLQSLLAENGIRQSDLAAHLGVSVATVSRRLNGLAVWTTDGAAALVAFLRSRGVETTMDALFGEEAA